MTNCKPFSTIEANLVLEPVGKVHYNISFKKLLRSLMYIMLYEA